MPKHVELPKWLVVGFSGHRDLQDRAPEITAAIRAKLEELRRDHGRIAGVCSVAAGADTLFAEQILELGAPLSIVLPFGLARFKQDFPEKDQSEWEHAKAVIDAVPAHRIDVVHRIESDLDRGMKRDPSVGTSSHDEVSYYEATVRTVDQADVLLAVWNEMEGKGQGGTADAVHYADALKIPVLIYNPVKNDFTRNDLARVTPVGAHPQIAPEASQNAHDTEGLRALLSRQKSEFDQIANEHQKPTRSLMEVAIYLHLIASAGAAFAIVVVESPHWKLIPATFEALVIGLTWGLLWWRGRHHHTWFSSRVAAEICRSFECTWEIRRYPTLVPQPNRVIADHVTEPSSTRPSLLLRLFRTLSGRNEHSGLAPRDLFQILQRMCVFDQSPPPSDLEEVRKSYLEERITGERGQAKYFRGKLSDARKDYNRYSLIGALASILSFLIAVTGVILLIRTGTPFQVVRICEWLGIALPLVVTACTFLLISSDAARRVHRYQQMIQALGRMTPKLAAAPTWDALSRAISETEEELLQEIVEWQSFVHYTEHLH